MLIWTLSLAAALAARRRATFCAGVSVSGEGDPPPPVAPSRGDVGLGFEACASLGFGDFTGKGRDERDDGGPCGDAEGEKVEAEGRELRTGGLEKAWGVVEVKRVASMTDEVGRSRRGVLLILSLCRGSDESEYDESRMMVCETDVYDARIVFFFSTAWHGANLKCRYVVHDRAPNKSCSSSHERPLALVKAYVPAILITDT